MVDALVCSLTRDEGGFWGRFVSRFFFSSVGGGGGGGGRSRTMRGRGKGEEEGRGERASCRSGPRGGRWGHRRGRGRVGRRDGGGHCPGGGRPLFVPGHRNGPVGRGGVGGGGYHRGETELAHIGIVCVSGRAGGEPVRRLGASGA
jgi:hypothetical protein